MTTDIQETAAHQAIKADLDANDVVLSYAAQWDTQHPLHKGRSGAFEYWPGLWGGFLNPPPPG